MIRPAVERIASQVQSFTAPSRARARRLGGGSLTWVQYPGVYVLRARSQRFPAARYAIAHYANGDLGPRWLCWFFPTGVHAFDQDGYRVAGGPPQGLFSMRRDLSEALVDAEHHLRTGECRP